MPASTDSQSPIWSKIWGTLQFYYIWLINTEFTFRLITTEPAKQEVVDFLLDIDKKFNQIIHASYGVNYLRI